MLTNKSAAIKRLRHFYIQIYIYTKIYLAAHARLPIDGTT